MIKNNALIYSQCNFFKSIKRFQNPFHSLYVSIYLHVYMYMNVHGWSTKNFQPIIKAEFEMCIFCIGEKDFLWHLGERVKTFTT